MKKYQNCHGASVYRKIQVAIKIIIKHSRFLGRKGKLKSWNRFISKKDSLEKNYS